jgi:hypothetical protein
VIVVTLLRKISITATTIDTIDLSANLYIYLPTYGSTALYLALAAFSVSQPFTQSVGLLGRGISPSQGCYLTQTQNKRTQTSMP